MHDFLAAAKNLARSPGYAAAFVLTLGLGIGANTAIFSAVRAVLLKPIPHRHGDRLVHLRQTAVQNAIPDATWSVPEISDYREASSTVDGFAEFSALDFNMLGHGEPRRVRSGIVSGNYFDVLGLRPVLGRLTQPSDDGRNADAVLVLTFDFWQRAFGGDPLVAGKTVRMNGRTLTIIGVLESVPHYPERTDVFVNMVASPHHMSASMNDERMHRMTRLFGRLAPGVAPETAMAELEGIAERLALEFPEAYLTTGEPRLSMTPLVDELVFRARPMLLLLLATSAFVLAIACANVTNLTLTRALRRSRELSVRGAFGAGQSTLRWLLLRENLVLSLAGGALGLGVTFGIKSLLVTYAARFTPRAMEIEVDGIVLSSCLAVAFAAAVLSALAPRLPLAGAPGSPGRSTSGTGQRALQRTLVVAQLALSFVLLAGAGLFARTLVNLSRVDSGYQVESVLSMEIPASDDGRTPAQLVSHFEQVRDETAALPGVMSAAIASSAPLSGEPVLFEVEFEGYQKDPQASTARADYRSVSPDYFDALGVPLRKGRPFTEGDDAEAAKVVVINESMAKFYFADRDPVGRKMRWSDPQLQFVGIANDWRTIVGVASDTRDYALDAEPPHVVYQPFAQEPWPGALVVRTGTDPSSVARSVVEVIRSLDGEQPVENVRTLSEIRSETLAPQKVNASLVSMFALLSLAIAAVGVFGVLAFSVGERTKEFGIRSTLGADARELLRMVLGEGMKLQSLALLVGIGAALLLAGFLRGFLFGIEPFDPPTLVLVAVVLSATALAASWLPAWRAARVAPIEVLRVD